ncbi:uncharacterized protein LOC127251660 [Andrographis paniculata]|uniref:uncharacterized protein LOC127251660 n=1 Tax=Andrographis paniculata TaxID=175694 RepID=UPI0021E8A66E|nr:uncharacterized protein LOC127251660 [Andrographis paniculata]
MEVCVTGNISASLDISSSIGSARDPQLSVNDLKTRLTKLVIAEDDEILISRCKSAIDTGVKEYQCGSDSDEIAFNNSTCDATSPPSSGVKSSEDVLLRKTGNHEEDIIAEVSESNGSSKPSSNQCFSPSLTLPVPSKLIPAMKGSREKHGVPPKKLSVSWAPDVYDPVPTSVSHVPSSKNHRHLSHGKKTGKHKHKGRGKSSSQGSSSRSKEKKSSRKHCRTSSKLEPFHEMNGVDSFGAPQVSSVDFDTRSPDMFCGSSFLKASVSKLHYSVAEAT